MERFPPPEPLKGPIRTMEEVKMTYFLRALATLEWNRSFTAIALNISLRTVRMWIIKARKMGYYIPNGFTNGNTTNHGED